MSTIPEYLNKSFDYSKLTKLQLIRIMNEQNVHDLPNIHALKAEILQCYKKNIFDKIDDIIRSNYSTVKNKSSEHTPIKNKSVTKNEPQAKMKEFDLESSEITRIIDSTPEKKISLRKENIFQEKKNSEPKFFSPLLTKIKDSAIQITPKKIPKISKDLSKPLPEVKKGVNIYFLFILLFFIPIAIFLKYFCPYCKEPRKFGFFISNPMGICVNVPEHSIYDKGLLCDSGYTLQENYLFPNKCVLDKTEEVIRDRIIRKAAIRLRKINMEYLYGLKSSNLISKTEIIKMCENMYKDSITGYEESGRTHQNQKYSRIIPRKDELIFDIVNRHSDIRDDGGVLLSTSNSFIFSVFLKFIFVRFMGYFMIPGLILFLIYFIRNKIKEKREKKLKHKKYIENVMKEINVALINHRVLSVNSTHVPVYLIIKQVKSFLDCEHWDEVRAKVRKNINVNEYKVGDDEVWEWIGPIMGARDLN